MKPIIGIVGRCNLPDSDEYNNINVGENYRMSVINSGGIPIGILPPQLVVYKDAKPSETPQLTESEKEILIRQIDLCDGILFPGGLKRFEYDIFILKYVLEKNIPVLGICLGMQIMTMLSDDGNQILNLEEIDSNINHASYEEDDVHLVTISKDSKLYSILKEDTFMVNSRHRMKITNPGTFKIFGYSEDGIPELIERDDEKFAIGVQWHPEILTRKSDLQKKIFDGFIENARGD